MHGVTTAPAAFRGLDQYGALFRAGDGELFTFTRRATGTGAISYSCESLTEILRRLHLQAGIEGGNASAARCTLAVTLHRKRPLGGVTMTAATITSKGQVTIPLDVRNQLGLQSGDRIEFSFNEATGRYEVYPATRSLASLKGIVRKPAKPVSIEDMNRAIAEQGASAR